MRKRWRASENEKRPHLVVGVLEAVKLALFGVANSGQNRRQCKFFIHVVISDITVEVV